MHPDKTLANDAAIFILGALLILSAFLIMNTTAGYPPADECAQIMRTSLSPYQQQALTESEQMPPRYETSRTWCEAHLNTYNQQIRAAMKWPMYPSDLGLY